MSLLDIKGDVIKCTECNSFINYNPSDIKYRKVYTRCSEPDRAKGHIVCPKCTHPNPIGRSLSIYDDPSNEDKMRQIRLGNAITSNDITLPGITR